MAKKEWMAVYTKPRSEKKVAERLSEDGFEVYCPLQTTYRQWSDRIKKVQIPVFPSYVFLHVEEKERILVLQDPGVLNFVYYLGKPAIIKDDEIQVIRIFLGELNEDEDVFIQQFTKGDQVDIIAGPLRETRGVIEKIKKKEVVLLVESLGITIKIKTKAKYISKTK